MYVTGEARTQIQSPGEEVPCPSLKFEVGADVGGPKTFVAGQDADDPMAAALLAIDGVTSVFMTADFVTLSKSPDAEWAAISPQAVEVLEEAFG